MKQQKNRMTNERDFRQDPNYIAPDPEKKKLILKLGNMITDRYLCELCKIVTLNASWSQKRHDFIKAFTALEISAHDGIDFQLTFLVLKILESVGEFVIPVLQLGHIGFDLVDFGFNCLS
jgi:hypothetical protein